MPYSIRWSEKANRQLRQVNGDLAGRIVKKVMGLKTFPFEKTEPLSGCDFRKIRVGKQRVVLEILPKRKLVKVILFGKRPNIYKMLKQIGGRG